jgi:anti-anti-sigma regulatory factor
MSTQFRIVTDGVPLLAVDGKLSIDELEDFESGADQLVRAGGKSAIIDLTGCPYMTSRSFPILVTCEQRLNTDNRRLYVACGEGLLEILKVLKLDRKLNLYSSVSQCVDAAEALSSL